MISRDDTSGVCAYIVIILPISIVCTTSMCMCVCLYTFQETNISHLGKRNIIFKTPVVGEMLVPWRVLLIYHDAMLTSCRYVAGDTYQRSVL